MFFNSDKFDFGYNAPEGLARCRELIRTRWRILLPLSLFFFCLGIMGLGFRGESRPDIAVLQAEFYARMGDGLKARGLELNNAYLVSAERVGGAEAGWATTWRYELKPLGSEWDDRWTEFTDCVEPFKRGKTCTTQMQVTLGVGR